MERKTVCLNMIVKDEIQVIGRCLDSVRPLIDSWTIVDTGSTDGTQQFIREALKDLPGQLFERPWKNFGHNRSEAIKLAKGAGDYLLFIDADDMMVVPDGFSMPPLTEGGYEITIEYGATTFRRLGLVNNALPWRWDGVLHEYPMCGVPCSIGQLGGGLKLKVVGGGGRSQVDHRTKYLRDAAILEEALAKEPGNTRYAFYLAQSYRDAGEFEKGIAAYDRRAAMTGFDEETFCAMLDAACVARSLGRPTSEILDRFLRAHEFRPSRAEPLGELAMYFREVGQRWPLAYLFAGRAIEIPMPGDRLFVGHEWYQWRCMDEYAIAAYWVGEYQESCNACENLLLGTALPPEHRPRVIGNLNFARERLGLPLVVT